MKYSNINTFSYLFYVDDHTLTYIYLSVPQYIYLILPLEYSSKKTSRKIHKHIPPCIPHLLSITFVIAALSPLSHRPLTSSLLTPFNPLQIPAFLGCFIFVTKNRLKNLAILFKNKLECFWIRYRKIKTRLCSNKTVLLVLVVVGEFVVVTFYCFC